MMASQRGPALSSARILADVLCGVDGMRSAYEAVRQAASLTTTDGHLTLLAVTAVKGSGQFEQAVLAPEHAKRALDHARRIARKAGVSSNREVADRGPVADVVLNRAGGHDVLALGAPSMSRLAHLLIGGVATAAAHRLLAADRATTAGRQPLRRADHGRQRRAERVR
jgi:nucleotide-binding universal stress UspA family protein